MSRRKGVTYTLSAIIILMIVVLVVNFDAWLIQQQRLRYYIEEEACRCVLCLLNIVHELYTYVVFTNKSLTLDEIYNIAESISKFHGEKCDIRLKVLDHVDLYYKCCIIYLFISNCSYASKLVLKPNATLQISVHGVYSNKTINLLACAVLR